MCSPQILSGVVGQITKAGGTNARTGGTVILPVTQLKYALFVNDVYVTASDYEQSLTSDTTFNIIVTIIVSAYRYTAVTNLPIIPVFVEYLGQFLIDFNQIFKHSSEP